MKQFELVIVGGGLTAARAIKSYREAGGGGRVALLAKEAVLPYHRPALSKRYLRGEMNDTPFVEDEAFYRANDVEVALDSPVIAVDPAREVTVGDGTRYRSEKLLIATGAEPRRLNVPGVSLSGVHSLRTLADSNSIREAARGAERAVIVGGGFIGMEVAASLRALDVEVSLIDVAPKLFAQLGSQQLSDELADLYRESGVDLLLGDGVASFEGGSGLAGVTTTSRRRIGADLAVVGIGVVPAVGFLAGSGVELANGIVVNERYETRVPGMYAAGDVANFFDPLFGRRRIEHWSNANYQGSDVGKILAGERGGYATVSSFFTEAFGVTVKVFGDVSHFDNVETEGSLAEREFVALYGQNGRLRGTVMIGQSEATEARLKQAIEDGAPFGTTDPLALALSA
jgi:NTE family protein